MRTLFDFLADAGKPAMPAVIEAIDGGFRLCAEIYAWGKITLLLTGCSFREGEVMPQGALMMHRFCAQQEGEQYTAILYYSLFDEELPQEKNLVFYCKQLGAKEQLLRYTEHAGLPEAALLREQTAMFSLQLLTKAFALDEDGLTQAEQALLDSAWLAVMNASPEYADALAALYGEDGLEQESRIHEIRACSQIENSEPLKAALEAFHEADETGDEKRIRSAQTALFQIFGDPACPELHSFYHRLFDAFLQANESFEPRRESESTAACLQFIDEFLREAGFMGAFPHYRRQRGQRGEYVSFAWSLDFAQEEAVVMLHLVSGTAFLIENALGPVPFAQSNAFDCEWMTAKSRCAILGACSNLEEERRLLQEALQALDGKALPVSKKIVPPKAALSFAGVGALLGTGGTLLLYLLLACALFVGRLMGRTARWALLTQMSFWGVFLLAAVLLGALVSVLYLYHVSRYPLGGRYRPKAQR